MAESLTSTAWRCGFSRRDSSVSIRARQFVDATRSQSIPPAEAGSPYPRWCRTPAIAAGEREEIASSELHEFNLPQFMVPADILWPLTGPQVQPGATDVHLWAACLDIPPATLARFVSVLTDDEQKRAARFRFDTHRNRFIAGRGILRALLGACLGCVPGELEFSYGPSGKPVLGARFAASGLSFNLAHSEGLALVAITYFAPIGVDVEYIRPIPDASELVKRFFSARENALFQSLPDDQKNIAFFNLWTRKEAWLKATGQGIAHSLNRVEVTFVPGEPARILALPDEARSRDDWNLRELLPAPGFVGAVALPDSQFSISSFQFSLADYS